MFNCEQKKKKKLKSYLRDFWDWVSEQTLFIIGE